jgi:hypothetical protein
MSKGYVELPKSREAQTEVPRINGSWVSSPVDWVKHPNGTRDFPRPGSSGEVFIYLRGGPSVVEDYKVHEISLGNFRLY